MNATTEYQAERERLASILTLDQRADTALRRTRDAVLRLDEATERRLDWLAVAPVLRKPVPPDVGEDEQLAWFELYAAAGALKKAVRDLELCLRGPREELHRRWCRGCRLLADTVVDALLAERRLDLPRISAIITGLNRVTERIGDDARVFCSHHAEDARRRIACLRTAGLDELAAKLENDPEVKACLEVFDEIAGRSVDLY